MPKKMSAREAWSLLAKEWAKRESDMTIMGVCYAINLLDDSGLLREGVSDQMRSAMEKYAPTTEGPFRPFRWDCGQHTQDRDSRAAFCRDMAARLARKKVSKS